MSEFQVMAGNDLRTGRVVYLTGDGRWTDEFLQAAQLTEDAGITVAQTRAAEAVAAGLVVDPYLVNVVAGRGGMPSHIRERIRQTGPTCLPDGASVWSSVAQAAV